MRTRGRRGGAAEVPGATTMQASVRRRRGARGGAQAADEGEGGRGEVNEREDGCGSAREDEDRYQLSARSLLSTARRTAHAPVKGVEDHLVRDAVPLETEMDLVELRARGTRVSECAPLKSVVGSEGERDRVAHPSRNERDAKDNMQIALNGPTRRPAVGAALGRLARQVRPQAEEILHDEERDEAEADGLRACAREGRQREHPEGRRGRERRSSEERTLCGYERPPPPLTLTAQSASTTAVSVSGVVTKPCLQRVSSGQRVRPHRPSQG